MGTALRKDKRERHEKLCKLITESIETDGQEFDGHVWAVRYQEDWADMLGVNVRTLRRLIKAPPIQSTVTSVEGVRATLLRLGEPGPPTPRTIAQTMARAFRTKTGQRVNPGQFGMLVGLAKEWPDGHQLAIFKYIISNEGWEWFMVGVGLEIALLKAEGHADLKKMFFKYPHIPTLRRFEGVAYETWKMHLQGLGKWPPAAA